MAIALFRKQVLANTGGIYPGVTTALPVGGLLQCQHHTLGTKKQQISMNAMAFPHLDRAGLCRRLSELHEHRPLANPDMPAMRIGIADLDGEMVHVVETPSLSEAVKVFEVLGDYGLAPRQGRHHTRDGRRLTRLYAPSRR
jgi:hypothetical protein